MTSVETPLTLAISKRAAARLRRGHPWVYRSDLLKDIEPPTAALVYVTDERGKHLGSALSSSSSQIALRMISSSRLPGEDALPLLIRQRVLEALQYRKLVVRPGTANAYRLIFSEADRLPGVIADRYNDVITLQLLTQAMNRPALREAIIAGLLDTGLLESPEANMEPDADGTATAVTLVERADSRIRELENLPPAETQIVSGTKTKTIFSLNLLKFHFDALEGQKTGAFLDQRENYAAAEAYAHGHALDVFCYEGGFALHLARKCSTVAGVDSSRPALEGAEKNLRLNKKQFASSEIEWIEANAFDLMKDYSATNKQYDTIVLDPPAFAKNQRAAETALRGYKELNLRALKMLRPGGVLVTCSCSFHVSESNFLEMLSEAAADAHRSVRVLEKRGQSSDHPTTLGIPETSYLKCVICQVTPR